MPPSPAEWLPEGHLAYFILDVLSELDVSAIDGAIQAKDPRGERPYNPEMKLELQDEVTDLMERAERADAEDDARFGAGQREEVGS